MRVPHPHSLFDFDGKIVVVTGAGSGLGGGIAIRFAEAGAQVVVNYRSSSDGAHKVVADIVKNNGSAIVIKADVTKKHEVAALVDQTLQNFGRVDVLINNAGLYPLSSVLDMTEEEWDLVMDANLRSTFLCTQAVASSMIKEGEGGAIVNIASIEGENPAPMHSHYNAAKGGVLMYTAAAALELGAHGIRVNAVSPGLIWREGLENDWPDGVTRWQQAAPLVRLGMPDDVADACLFLASPGARWITGANIRVDGGVMTNQIF